MATLHRGATLETDVLRIQRDWDMAKLSKLRFLKQCELESTEISQKSVNWPI
jgi:hypothetical protein